METSNENALIFENTYSRCQYYLNFMGIHTEKDENRKRVFLYKLYYYFNLQWGYTDIVGQLVVFFKCIINAEQFTEVTKVTPCMIMSIVAIVQAQIFASKKHIIRDLHTSILLQFSKSVQQKDDTFKTRMKFLNLVISIQVACTSGGLLLFGLIPFFRMLRQYYLDEKIILTLPFVIYYPIDTQILFNWIISYIHEMWSGAFLIAYFILPYLLCYTCLTAIAGQFNFLGHDITALISGSYESMREPECVYEKLRQLTKIAKRHLELIRCVELLEEMFTFPNLLNVIASSILLCLTAFNFMMLNDMILALPYLQFLVICVGQIFFICYYGDLAMQSSFQLSDALYDCHWYNADRRIVKNILIMFVRAQKPCKFTAYGFSDINLNSFAVILSSSTSYFALLRTLYLK